jgi:NAD(P)-dependent dehydrogenase (short-subunit alcohol dehydrogenase family)
VTEVPHVVVGGGGFGGLYTARALAGRRVRVTLLDRRNHHLFQPLLYQVATAALNASDIAAPLRSVLRKADNVTVLLAPVERVDPPPVAWCSTPRSRGLRGPGSPRRRAAGMTARPSSSRIAFLGL